MSKIIPIGSVIERTLTTFDEKFLNKLLRQTVFLNWEKIAAAYAADVVPVKVIGDVLFLQAKTSAAKDNLKFIAKDLLDNVNKILGNGKEVFKKIEYAKTFMSRGKLKKFSARPKKILQSIELSAEE